MMNEDDDIARYIFNMPSHTIQFARFSDWFFDYAELILLTTIKKNENVATVLEFDKAKIISCQKIMELKPAVEAKLNKWVEE
jgi:hypothetical protein